MPLEQNKNKHICGIHLDRLTGASENISLAYLNSRRDGWSLC